MGVVCFNDGGCIILILAMIIITNVAGKVWYFYKSIQCCNCALDCAWTIKCTQDKQIDRQTGFEARISLNSESAVLGWCIIIVSRGSAFHLLRASDFRFCAHPLQMARTTPWKVLKLKKQFQGSLKTSNLLQVLETSSKIIREIALQRTTWYTCDFFSCPSNRRVT
jgi:hypothetical protein